MEPKEQERKQMIADALERQGMTQTDFARAMGRSWTTIQAWVNQKSIPELTPQETLNMCAFFDCTLEDLANMFPGTSKRRKALQDYARANPNRKNKKE